MHSTVPGRVLSVAIAALLVFTMLPLLAAPPAAYAATPPSGVDYNSVDFVDEMWGWVAGSNGTILRTKNGGHNWEILDTPTTETFVAASFVDRNNGWALTVNARVYRTLNGGDTWLGPSAPSWRGSSIPDYHEGIGYDLEFVSASTGFLTARAYVPDSGRPGVCGLVYRTTNGGLTWTLVLEKPDYKHPDDVYPEGNSILRGLDFVSGTHGWVVGIDKWPAVNRSLVYRTTDGGSNWTSAGTGIAGSADLYGVSFANTSVGLVVGSGGAIRKSTNGGVTWTAQTSGTSNTLRDVHMLDTQIAWAVGDGGLIRRTTNGGTTWLTDGWVIGTGDIYSVDTHGISSGFTGWTVGSNGRVGITTDGLYWWGPDPGPTVTGLSSATHPDQNAWYGDAAGLPQFSWDPVPGAEGYSVSFSTDRTEVPAHQVTQGASETEWTFAGPMSDGVWYFNVKAKAVDGNWGSPATYVLRYDITVPSGSIVLAGGATATKAHDISATSSVQWGPSGADAIAFSFDGGATWGAWRDYVSPIGVTLPSGDGDKTVHARFRNGAGTVSETGASDSIILDTLVPSANVSINDGASATATRDVEVSVSVSDWGVSGQGQMCFSTNGGTSWDAWRTFSSPAALTLPSGDGLKTVHVQVRDAAGNVSPSASDSIVLDAAAPEITAIDSPSHPEEVVWYPGRNVQLEWSAQSLSGVFDYSYTWNAGSALEPDTQEDTSESTHTIEGVADGEWHFSVRALNVLGVWGPSESRMVRIDGTKPLGTVTINGGAATTNSTSVQVTSNVAWGVSGPHAQQAMRISTNGGSTWQSWRAYASPVSVTLPAGAGTKTVSMQFQDAAGNISAIVSRSIELSAETLPSIIKGDNRYLTAIAGSRAAFDRADAVVIATGEHFADALGGAGLAGALDAPLLLTQKGALPSAVATEIGRLGASKAYILGGAGAVSDEVGRALDRLPGVTSVIRIAGNDRYQTASAVAAETIKVLNASGTYNGDAFIATGANFPDALGASPVAASQGMPVFLADPARPSVNLPASVKRVWITGGTAVVSTGVENSLKSKLSTASVKRLAGGDRFATAAAVARFGVGRGMTWDGVGITTGMNFPDALAAGPVLGSRDAVMLLTDSNSVPGYTRSELTANKSKISKVTFFGGDAAVPPGVRATVNSLIE